MTEATETSQEETGYIKATKKDSDRVVKVHYPFPESLQGLTEKFGEDAVYGAAVDAFTINVQALIRRNFDKSDEDIQAAVNGWVPGVRQVGVKKSPLERAQAALRSMSAEDRAALLASLQG